MKKVLVMLMGLSASLSAATVSYSHTTPTTATPLTDTFTLSNFNTSFGTLTSVLINFSATTTAEVDIFNTTATPQPFTNATASINLVLTAPTGTIPVTATAGPFNGTANVGANAFPGITGTTSNSISPVNLAAYQGGAGSTSSYTVTGGPSTDSGSAAPGVFFGGSATAGGLTTITYTYTAPTGTPEPATMGLLGSALIGLGFLKFRTKKS